MINNNIDKSMINSASAFARIDDENKKLAKRIADEEERKYKNITDGVQKQISLLEDNLRQSKDSYNKLNELFELKNQELEENKKELESSKKYNKKMFFCKVFFVFFTEESGLSLTSVALILERRALGHFVIRELFRNEESR